MRATLHMGSGWQEHLLMLGRFVRHPRRVGAIAPSSRVLARAMVQPLNLAGPVRVVELGPGTGVITSQLVARLGPDARLLAVDIDAAFVEALERRWPRLECVCASAERLAELAAARHMHPVDHIVSGLPFASLPMATTRRIVDAIASTLRPGGTFTTFQYLHGYALPAAVRFRRDMATHIGPQRRPTLVARNVPPALVLTWRRA